jgi:hypothetical protein
MTSVDKFAVSLLIFVVPTLVSEVRAATAYPVMLYNGKVDGNSISLSFMNKSKIPIRQIDFVCVASRHQKAIHRECHRENGIFFPGTPYNIRFDYTGTTPSNLEVSVSAVQLDGFAWTAVHDQQCHAVRIVRKHS